MVNFVSDKSELTKDDIMAMLNSNNIEDITNALLYMTFTIEDFEWIQKKCMEMVQHKNPDISGLAITCLGHVARIYGKINIETIDFLKNQLMHSTLAGRAQDALDDIEIFVQDESTQREFSKGLVKKA